MKEKIGVVDAGGGLRDIYGAGIFDYLLDNNISLDYGIGVSAGSANIASYLAKQKGRNKVYYKDYSFRKSVMSSVGDDDELFNALIEEYGDSNEK